MIDRYLLRYFLAVVDHGAFTKAAASVHVAQPTLSVGIAKLERLVGAPLFHRSNQRVSLTEAGAKFAAHARRIEREFALAESAFSRAGPRRTLRLGVLHTVAAHELEDLAARLKGVDDAERLEMVEGSERDLAHKLAQGRIDLALSLVREDQRFVGEPLREEPYTLAVASSHPAADEAVVTGESLAGEVMIVRRNCEALSQTSRYFTERGVRPFFCLKTTQDERAMALVRAGTGITVIPQRHAGPGVACPRLAGFDLTRTLGLLYGPEAEALAASSSPVMEALRAVFAA